MCSGHEKNPLSGGEEADAMRAKLRARESKRLVKGSGKSEGERSNSQLHNLLLK